MRAILVCIGAAGLSVAGVSAEKLNFVSVSACLVAKKAALDERDKARTKLDAIYQPLSHEFAEAAKDYNQKSVRHDAIAAECLSMQRAEQSAANHLPKLTPAVPHSASSASTVAAPPTRDAAAALADRYGGPGNPSVVTGSAAGGGSTASASSLSAIMAGGGQGKAKIEELVGDRLDASIAYDNRQRAIAAERARIAELQRQEDERRYRREQAEFERELERERQASRARTVNALSRLGTAVITGRPVPPTGPVGRGSSGYSPSTTLSSPSARQSTAACSATLQQIQAYRVTLSEAEVAARAATSPGAGGGAGGSGVVGQANEIAQLTRDAIRQNQAWYDANCR